MSHDDVHEDAWEDKQDTWIDYFRNKMFLEPVLFTLDNRRHGKKTHFGVKNILSLAKLSCK